MDYRTVRILILVGSGTVSRAFINRHGQVVQLLCLKGAGKGAMNRLYQNLSNIYASHLSDEQSIVFVIVIRRKGTFAPHTPAGTLRTSTGVKPSRLQYSPFICHVVRSRIVREPALHPV